MGRKRIEPITPNPFSEKITNLRQLRGFSLEDLSQKVGISKSYISLLEAGRRQPSRNVVIKLSQALYPEGNPAAQDKLLILAGFTPEDMSQITAHDVVSLYEEKLKSDPKDFKVFITLLLALIRGGDYEQAQQKIQEGFSLFNQPVQLQSLLSNLELSRGNYEGAVLANQAAVQQCKPDTKEAKIMRSYLLVNTGVIYFVQGTQALGEYLGAQEKDDEKQVKKAKKQAVDLFSSAKQYYQEALEFGSSEVYILDEYARVNFNLAYLKEGKTAQAYWEEAIESYKQVIYSRDKHFLGQEVLQEASAFLVLAYAKCQRFDEAEYTLNLLTTCISNYWLLYYIEACYFNLRYEKEKKTSYLAEGIQSLKIAASLSSSDNRTKIEAAKDPDLKSLRVKKSKEFDEIINS